MNPPDLRIPNRIVGRLIRLGVPMGPMAIITVPGRRSGQPRSVPIAVAPHAGGWRLVAAYGVVDWVKNLRAAGTGTLTFRGKSFPVRAHELAPPEAAVLLRESMATAGRMTLRMVGPYFSASPDDPISAWEAETARHPVFLLTRAQTSREYR
jgi:deazaflavin-dependent oxidoreductase (nitroreductase family)